MRIDIISAQPDLLQSPFQHSILKRAQEKGLLEIVIHNLRDYAINKHGQIDDTPYGGGAGMILMCEPLSQVIEKLKNERSYDQIIFLTPDGKTYNQSMCNTLSLQNNIMLLCGHYKGIDQRIRDLYVTLEISIGDYVLTGGELAAAILVDSIGRLIPGVLNDETSALSDSFQDNLLAPPVYTKPAIFNGLAVPDVLLSGHFQNIDEWRYEESVRKTKSLRPDLLNDEE
ncbi:MAG: tRNA (guanosine(37)-N1)-methyltransferase TrmD [Chitinophagaceae bacterium]